VNSTCPYCRTELDDQPLECPGCGTPHHPECYEENGGCTVFGCSSAPAAEAKISVAESDWIRPLPPLTPGPAPAVTSRGAASPWLGNNAVLGSIATPPQSLPAEPTGASNPPARIPTPPPPIPGGGTGVAPPPMPSPRGVYNPLRPADLYPVPKPKKRVNFVLLAIFLGLFGVHNFYAGYAKRGAIQLCVTVLTLFYGTIVTWPWAIVEACIINVDGDGEQFA
jgi:TM2 domain-containing membrane protein YozV